jgi:hypothetical protein
MSNQPAYAISGLLITISGVTLAEVKGLDAIASFARGHMVD